MNTLWLSLVSLNDYKLSLIRSLNLTAAVGDTIFGAYQGRFRTRCPEPDAICAARKSQ
jgi:hypothetical protein